MSVQSDLRGAHATTERLTGGNPALLGLPAFLPGGLTLGLWLVGYLPATLPGGMIAAALIASGMFLLLTSAWAARAGHSVETAIFGVYSAFWLSFGFLMMGLVNNWFGTAADPTLASAQSQSVQATFFLAWLVVFVAMTLATLRLPLAYTAGFVFVCATLALLLGFALSGNALFAMLGGIAMFVVCAIYAYVFLDGMGQELGGRAMPMGQPIQH
jgi:succinate-acetate transporter protein